MNALLLVTFVALVGQSLAQTSCADIKAKGNTADGIYPICINQKSVNIYCHGLDTDAPKEYIQLQGNNFADVYGPRQWNGWMCDGPIDPTPFGEKGHTTFSAVRLDVNTLQVVQEDFLFSTTTDGKQVPFGIAGDCHSWAGCPKGTFRIDLTGTDFHISPNTEWESVGWGNSWTGLAINEARKVARSTCGGWCGSCQPVGGQLILEVDANTAPCGEPVPCPGVWKCNQEGATVDYNFATCVNGFCGCKPGFQGYGTRESKCRCEHQVFYNGNEAHCIPAGACINKNWHCGAVTEQHDFVECSQSRCRCKTASGFTPEYPSANDKCRCEGTLVWVNSEPICQHE